jgi:hypothetical protein
MAPRICIFLVNLFFVSLTFGQEKQLSPEATVNANIGGVAIEIQYCRPSARGRKMVGGVDPYGKVWRTGANKATSISFDKDVVIEGKNLAKGKYGFFTIPQEDEWTIIFNKTYDQWGAYDYDEKQDVLRVVVKAKKSPSFVETFTITPGKDNISLIWENFIVPFRVKPS